MENSTKKQYRSILNTTIEPFFKARSIVSLKVADIEQWLLWMERDRKLSARTRRQRFSFFSGMMDWAVVNEIIGRNPCKKVKGAGSRAKEIREHKSKSRRLTTREVLAMLEACPPRYRAMLWLMAGCGLRLGEAMAVSRDQVDFKAETLRVDFQITEDGETESGKNSALQRRHIKARDEEEPGRIVPLPPNVAFELRRHIKNHGVWGPERLLFPNVTRTGYLYASYFYPKIWMVALDKGGVTYCKPHSLRHYYGSRLLYAGVPENDVADWMGHSSTDVLREHYHYIFEGAEQRGRAAIATMLTPGADDPDDPTDASEVA
ncbi:tyrosine-type recombinase/integrase [Streptomyces nogalater]|uniref:Tyrosine-type recombinase/integrase n=1 Tax=Streptomyces nogalater TaxID=38314 RepID=A0ABW0WA40_STRNO